MALPSTYTINTEFPALNSFLQDIAPSAMAHFYNWVIQKVLFEELTLAKEWNQTWKYPEYFELREDLMRCRFMSESQHAE